MTRWRTALALVLASASFAAVTAAGIGRAWAAPERRPVPEVVGLSEADASSLLAAAGFAVETRDAASEPAGFVASQSPGGFAWAAPGSSVTIEVRRGADWKPGAPSRGPGGERPSPSGPGPRPGEAAGSLPRVPTVLGKTEIEALDLLRLFRVQLATTAGSAANEGRVVDQDPPAGTPLAEGGRVSITVARADAGSSATATVPSVVGLDQEAASQRLTAAGLVPLVDLVMSDPANAGKVVGQDPAAGNVIARNSNVALMVGRPKVGTLLESEVPDLSRLPEADARTKAEQAGFVVLVKDRLAPPETAGTVLEQDPAPGARWLRGRTVTLTVGRLLLLPIAVPDVSGQDAAAAEKALRDAGFAVEQAFANSLPGSGGRVMAQDPAGGATANRGSTVRITVGRPATAAAPTVTVPALVGRTEEQARADLLAAGLAARSLPVPAVEGEPTGRVRGQAPPAGSPIARGTEVVIEVASSAPVAGASPLPSYVGQDAVVAQTDLATRGFRALLVYVTGAPEGKVVSQSPPAGTSLPAGASITLTVARAPTLGMVVLLDPAQGKSVPRNFGVTFEWAPVPEAENYEFEIMVDRDQNWVVADHDIVGGTVKRPHSVKRGIYQWHVRARKANGTVVGPWSEWRRLTIY